MDKNNQILEYKSLPLVRHKNNIYYGSAQDKYMALLQLTEFIDEDETKMPSKILVSLYKTDENLSAKDKVVKSTEKTSFYEAIEIAQIWLERALSGK